ncbi:maleylpyruvate isomerase family mycothiol-dependent enzyme [Catellatospora sp. KI3]|uniref:maleylpyruvate isomerase family mycothiol-dependent enzyme n=1 Tax=Catellatospora sp. KI3 TaxID=3041620 RepID=UPI002482422E|nr:maleylpyruvate isomerase family mycothiol-dependent enzyme [Catellatospora sp. KI3]MDI1463152.1 maleylpyruvate isomerase family mycothiol-dependent enzyme [Catellatospora sp. KI3]
MTSNADAAIAALRSGYDHLAPLVAGLDEDGLAGPSGSAEWDVSQVLSHLGSGAEIHLATLEAALAGEPNKGIEFNRGVWARWDAMSRTERATAYVTANEKMLRRYEELDPATRKELRVDLGFLPAPVDVATSAGLRLSEFTFHSWDVRVGTDPAAVLHPEAVPLLLGFTGGMFAWLAKPAALEGREAKVRVELTEPHRVLGLHLADPVVLGDVPEQPDGVLHLPAEAWLRLVVGRLSPEHTPAGVAVEGAADLDLLRRVFKGF